MYMGRDSRLRRRAFLKGGGAAALSLATARQGSAEAAIADGQALLADPAGIIDLPEGFSYRVLQRRDEIMDDGFKVPVRPDGMGCFTANNGDWVLLRNHEVFEGDHAGGPYLPLQRPPPEAFDAIAGGGVTRLVIDPATGKPRSSNLVLTGTYWNCAGGPSPEGWLTCEETITTGHGYVFLCDPEASRVKRPRRLTSLGRFRHEAAGFDRDSGITYLTEDRPDSALYRFVPDDPGQPFDNGRLQALKVVGIWNYHADVMNLRKRLDVEWVTIDDPDPVEDTVRLQAQAKGAARFNRGEGIWVSRDSVLFTATGGGPIGRGQVLELELSTPQRLRLLAQSEDPEVLDMPDNLVVGPTGHAYLCEDGLGDNYMRRITRHGQVVPFARNASGAGEFAGACFSPDGTTLFVNIQDVGLTLGIVGPFDDEDALDRVVGARRRPLPGDGCAPGVLGASGGFVLFALAALARRSRGKRPEE